MIRRPPRSPLFPSPPLFRSAGVGALPPVNAAAPASAAFWASEALDASPPSATTEPLKVAHEYEPSSCSYHSASLPSRSEEHTSELQSPCNLVCRLLLEKKKT